jgi:hypothetical protein
VVDMISLTSLHPQRARVQNRVRRRQPNSTSDSGRPRFTGAACGIPCPSRGFVVRRSWITPSTVPLVSHTVASPAPPCSSLRCVTQCGAPPTSTQRRGNGPLGPTFPASGIRSGQQSEREFVDSPLPSPAQAGPRILPLAGPKEPEIISPRFEAATAGIWASNSINCVSLALRRRSLVG